MSGLESRLIILARVVQKMNWHVVSLNTRQEIETAKRISDAGFVARCPVFVKKSGHHRGGKHFFRTRVEPLFPAYIFVQADDAFQKHLFETSKVRLTVFRKKLLSEMQMEMIESTALNLTAMQNRTHVPLKIKRGELMRILYGEWQGKLVKASCDERNGRVKIEFQDEPEWRDVNVAADRLERVA